MFFPPSSIWRDIILCRISEPTIAFYHGRIWWISLQIAGYVDDGWILIGVKNRVRIFYSNQLFGINEGIELIYRRLHRLSGCSRSWELYFFWFIPSIKRHVRTYHRYHKYHSFVIIAEILIFLRSSCPRWCGVNIDRYYNIYYTIIIVFIATNIIHGFHELIIKPLLSLLSVTNVQKGIDSFAFGISFPPSLPDRNLPACQARIMTLYINETGAKKCIFVEGN